MVRNAVGDPAAVAGLGTAPTEGTQADLEKLAGASDTAAALRMQEAKRKLFAEIRQKRTA